MDWTGYPKSLSVLLAVNNLADLALFLAPANDPLMSDVLKLIDKAAGTVAGIGALATAYPREVLAYRVWKAAGVLPLAGALLATLKLSPDPSPSTPPTIPTTPVLTRRILIYGIPERLQASITVAHRVAADKPWINTQWLFPVPVVDVSPGLLNGTSQPGQLSLQLTAASS